MNRINAKVSTIQREDHLTLVSFETEDETLQMIALDLSPLLQSGSLVTLGIKATNIILAKEFKGHISISNTPKACIESVSNGALLSSITLLCCNTTMECITTLEASKQLSLQANDTVYAMIKASDLSILSIDEEVV